MIGTDLWGQMKFEKWDKVSLKKSNEETEVDPVRELSVQIARLQVQLVQVLVRESQQWLFNELQK